MARKTDGRRSDRKSSIWEYLLDTFTTTSGGTAEQTVTFNDSPGGIVTRILLTVSTSTGSETATLTLDDADSFEIFNSGAKAAGASYVMDVDVPYVGALTIGMTPGGDPGASGQTVIVKLMGE